MSQSDLTAVNFEGTLVGAPYGSENASAPQTLMDALRNAGVDLIQMANSCAINNGLNGLTATLNAVQNGIYLHIGQGIYMSELSGGTGACGRMGQ